jgi:heptosyltransferase-2
MRIIVLPLYGIGDALMTTPALRNIKEHPGAYITYLHMFRSTYEIMGNNPNIDENIHFPFLEKSRLEGLRFLLGFRGKFDVSINFYPSNRKDYNMASFIIGCKTRIGHRYRIHDLRELNFLKNKTLMEDDSLHCVEENLRLLDFLGIGEKKPYTMEIHLTKDEKDFASGWLNEKDIDTGLIIGMHPGTSVFKGHDMRRWPLERFSAFINGVHEKHRNAAFVLFGGPEEKPLREKIISMVVEKGGIYSADAFGIRQSAALIERCRLFVTNDSGLLHVAAALNVPTVAVFGPTNPAWVRPWGQGHRVISLSPPLKCSPCFRYSPLPLRCYSKSNFACLRDIEEKDVIEAVESLI